MCLVLYSSFSPFPDFLIDVLPVCSSEQDEFSYVCMFSLTCRTWSADAFIVESNLLSCRFLWWPWLCTLGLIHFIWLCSLIYIAIGSNTIINKYGLSGHPCRTPPSVLTISPFLPFVTTIVSDSSYDSFVRLIILSLTFVAFSVSSIVVPSALVKAFLMSVSVVEPMLLNIHIDVCIVFCLLVVGWQYRMPWSMITSRSLLLLWSFVTGFHPLPSFSLPLFVSSLCGDSYRAILYDPAGLPSLR